MHESHLGGQLASWASRAAATICIANGIEAKCSMRGSLDTPKQGQLYSTRRQSDRPGLILPSDPVVLAWSGAETQLRLVARFCGTGRGTIQVKQAVEWLRKHVLPNLRNYWKPKRTKTWVEFETREVPQEPYELRSA